MRMTLISFYLTVLLASSSFADIIIDPDPADYVPPAGFSLFMIHQGVVNLTGATAIKLDVTMYSSEWPSGNWLNIGTITINSGAGWREFTDTAIDRITGLPCPTVWATSNGDAFRTYSWDISGQDWSGVTNWMEMIIAVNDYLPNAGTIYTENLRLIPEPATIALLGLSGLALLRRKK